jgi:hypothetical protein
MLDVHCFLHRLNNFLFLADGWCLHGSKASSQYVWLSVMTIGHFCYPEEHKKFVELWDWLYPVTCESGHHPVWWLLDFVKLIHHCFEWNLIFKHVYWCKSWVFFVKSLDPTSSLTGRHFEWKLLWTGPCHLENQTMTNKFCHVIRSSVCTGVGCL